MVKPNKLVIFLSSCIYFSESYSSENTNRWGLPHWPQQLFGGLAGKSIGEELGKNFKDGCETIATGYAQGTTMEHTVSITPATRELLNDLTQKLEDLKDIHPQGRITITITPTTGKVISGASLSLFSAYTLSNLAQRYITPENQPSFITGCVVGACSIASLVAGTALLFHSGTKKRKPKSRHAD